jgi:hypothetical protein
VEVIEQSTRDGDSRQWTVTLRWDTADESSDSQPADDRDPE